RRELFLSIFSDGGRFLLIPFAISKQFNETGILIEGRPLSESRLVSLAQRTIFEFGGFDRTGESSTRHASFSTYSGTQTACNSVNNISNCSFDSQSAVQASEMLCKFFTALLLTFVLSNMASAVLGQTTASTDDSTPANAAGSTAGAAPTTTAPPAVPTTAPAPSGGNETTTASASTAAFVLPVAAVFARIF
ncbi:hypothetical protein PRIPAC_74583, partial [Pristionchus pacificus]|uniref:Uncharacterized protein n=1 Tax=Pristionchus pacificus TaxID=54126 RepID=A0A2A6CF01_PRIPA